MPFKKRHAGNGTCVNPSKQKIQPQSPVWMALKSIEIVVILWKMKIYRLHAAKPLQKLPQPGTSCSHLSRLCLGTQRKKTLLSFSYAYLQNFRQEEELFFSGSLQICCLYDNLGKDFSLPFQFFDHVRQHKFITDFSYSIVHCS